MGEVRKQARLHERTVQKVAKGEAKSPKRRKQRKQAKEQTFDSSRIQKDVWAKVRAMKPNLHHIQIVSPTDVVIWNHPAPWPTIKKGERGE